MSRTYEDITRYVEDQSQGKCKVLSAKTEHIFDDLGHKVNVWNVKTDNDGDWWVVEGDQSPMNLYPQGAYYFSADEVYCYDNTFPYVKAYCDAITVLNRLDGRYKGITPITFITDF